MNCIIIDDEQAARSRLARMLALHTSVTVIGEASDGLQALERIEELHPDLIFLDIQMPGLNGFEVLRSMPKGVPYPLVVFVTGFDAHALEAFEANALAYLLKPVETERLAAVLERAAKICEYERLREQEAERTAQIAQSDVQPLSQIVARKRDRFVLLSPGEILYFTAEDGVIKAKTASETYLVNYQLADLETGLPSATFFRARRSVLVNLARVKEICPYFKSSFLLVMDDTSRTEIQVSERQAKVLRQRIPGL